MDYSKPEEPKNTKLGKSIGRVIGEIIGVILSIHIFISMLAYPVFCDRYAEKHGLTERIFFGEIVPYLQALSWEYHIWKDNNNWSEEEIENMAHWYNARVADREILETMDGLLIHGGSITEDQLEWLLQMHRYTLREAKAVRADVLEKAHPGMNQAFQLFIRSHEMAIGGYRRGSLSHLLQSETLRNEWVDWYNAHNSEINIPKSVPDGISSPFGECP